MIAGILGLVLPLFLHAQTSETAVILSVMPFRSIGDSVALNLGDSFSETITTKLIGLKGLKVYERAQFDKINAELSLQRDANDMIDPTTLAKAGSIISMDYMILGSVTLAGQKLACQLRLVRVKDGMAILSKTFEGTYPKSIFELQDSMALQLTEALKLKLSDLDKRRLAKKPTESIDTWNLYNQSLGSKNINDRIKLLEKAVAADPAFSQAAHLLADLYLETKNIPKAMGVYGTIISKDPTDYRALFNQGMLAFDRGDYSGATTVMEMCLEQKDSDPDIYYHLGLFNEFLGAEERFGPGVDVAKVINWYQRALVVDPQHRESLVGLSQARLIQVNALEKPEDQFTALKEAKGAMETYLRLSPDADNAGEMTNTLDQVNAMVQQFEEYFAKLKS